MDVRRARHSPVDHHETGPDQDEVVVDEMHEELEQLRDMNKSENTDKNWEAPMKNGLWVTGRCLSHGPT